MTAVIRIPAPDFEMGAESSQSFYAWKGARWSVIVLVPDGQEPMAGRDLANLELAAPEFATRKVPVVVVAGGASPVVLHSSFPIVADEGRGIAEAYASVGSREESAAVRTFVVVSPSNQVALTASFHPKLVLPVHEMLRVVDSLQLSRYKIATAADWEQGDEMVLGRVVPDPIGQAKYGSVRVVTPYLRLVPQPPWETRPRPTPVRQLKEVAP